MEVYPFHHQNRFFTIITDLDLSFQEVRDILDYLLKADAFPQKLEEIEGGKIHDFRVGEVHYTVDVSGYEVIIYRRGGP